MAVWLGDLVSHERDFSVYRTSFVTLRLSESGIPSPLLAIPHSLSLPIPLTPLERSLLRWDWHRCLLNNITRFPIQAVVFRNVEVVEVINLATRELPLDDDPFSFEVFEDSSYDASDSEALERSSYGGSDSEDEGESLVALEEASVGSSESRSSVGYTSSIEDLVGADWVRAEGWAAEVHSD
jgi:hypothetical protein